MRRALWPREREAAHRIDMAAWLAGADAAVLVAERADRQGLAGFTERGTRLYADGCETSPVAYLEGWYVDRDLRRQGIGTALVRAAEMWARAPCALGFIEVERAVRYRKRL
jgi:aminoglycoside 6'-N-acetyltransferase I